MASSFTTGYRTLQGLSLLAHSGEEHEVFQEADTEGPQGTGELWRTHYSHQLQKRLTWAAASAELLPQWGKPGQSSGMCYSGTPEGQEVSLK